MRAIEKSPEGLRLIERPDPIAQRPDDVLLEVLLAGICRTDVYAARGDIVLESPRILGHEFCARVIATGEGVDTLEPGDRVSAFPFLACDRCPVCLRGEWQRCLQPSMIGLQADGAFAEKILMPARNLHKLPESLSDKRGAYTEPVAASTAVLQAPISPVMQGIIYGTGRIAELTRRVMQQAGYEDIRTVSPAQAASMEPASLDYVVETRARREDLDVIFELLRPGGLLLLKSRPALAPALDIKKAVLKEIRMQGVHYGGFDDAIERLTTLPIDDLLGEAHPLEAFRPQLLRPSDEQKKRFLDPTS